MIVKVMQYRKHNTSEPHIEVGNVEWEGVPRVGEAVVKPGGRVHLVQSVFWPMRRGDRVEVWLAAEAR